MNYRELAAVERYKKDGWSVLHEGAPDLLLVRLDAAKRIAAVKFREVKSPADELTYAQKVWRDALRFLGAECETEVIE